MARSTINPRHLSNVTAKAARFAGVLKDHNLGHIPAQLEELARETDPQWREHVEAGWLTLTALVNVVTGGAETVPHTSRPAIAVLCRPAPPAVVADPFAGIR